jgi:glycosyltransferase involved in cell wall biosynthesis
MSRIEGIRVAYLCLQATIPGQASHAHALEIIAGLRAQGATIDLFEPAYAEGDAPGAAGRLLEFFRVQRRLLRSLKDYDLLYVRGHALAWWAAREAYRSGVPVVQECNGMVDDFFIAWPTARRYKPLVRKLTYWQFRHADEVIVGSEGLGEWLRRETGKVGNLIPNGANIELFKPMGRPDDIPLPENYAVFFGSLAPWQGIDTTLAAVREPEWPADVSLVILGAGLKEREVVTAAAEDPRVIYLGKVPYDRVAAVVSNAVCSLVNKEQVEFAAAGISPLKLYESMACGIPVIATDRMPGLTNVVEEQGTGLIVPQGDPVALARAVATLFDSPEMRQEMGARGRAYAVAEGSWYARSVETANVIAAALESASGRRKALR